MKKVLIVSAVILVAVIALAAGGLAYAQTQTPGVPFGRGVMGGGYGQMQGMMGGRAFGQMHGRGFGGQLRTYMESAMAEAFGLSTEELQAAQQEGKSLLDLAKEQGLTVAEFQEKMDQARQNALKQAVADGVITQAQADQLNTLKEGAKGRRAEMGAMHDAMQAAIAAEFSLTVEELEARKDAGDTMMDLASEQGLSVEEFEAKMTSARTKALDQAVADGTITQEQADWMLQHMGPLGMGGLGRGGCMGGGSRGSGMGPGMHRFSPPAGPTN